MIQPGDIYRHYKGNEYRIITVSATCSETLQQLVVYQDIQEPDKIWVRPYEMFFDHIELDEKLVERFTKVI